MRTYSISRTVKKEKNNCLKRMKGKRVLGVDGIDLYSLKLAAPLIEDYIPHMVNLSVESQSFAKLWKPQLILPFHKKKEKTQA